MLLRVQHERHSGDPNEKKFDAHSYHEKYGINHKRYEAMKKKMRSSCTQVQLIIMLN